MSLDYKCETCKQPAGKPCRNTMARKNGRGDITPETPLPGRTEHFARVAPPTPKKEEK